MMPSRENVVKPLLGTALCLLIASCGGGGSSSSPAAGTPGNSVEFDRNGMLRHLGEQVVQPQFGLFRADIESLKNALIAWQAEPANVEKESATKAAFSAAMTRWQLIELFQFGPLKDKFYRDEIYSWPTVNSCAVDQTVATYQHQAGFTIGSTRVNRRGLDALEYLLYAPSLEVTAGCNADVAVWAGYDDVKRRDERLAYSVKVSDDLIATMDQLIQRWAGDQGYLNTLSQAGQAGSTIASAQEAVNLISDGMFYIESHGKDRKVGVPAGILSNSCGSGQPCTDDLESQYAERSKPNLIANLEAFRALMTGDPIGSGSTNGVGFDDFLKASGDPDLSNTMLQDIDSALTLLRANNLSFKQMLATDTDAVNQIYNRIKAVTDNLKGQFVVTLKLDKPETVSTDND